jgi:hypothetical protein
MRGFFTNVGRSRSNMKKALLIGALALLGALTIAGQAFAATPTFFNGFETDTTGWVNDSGTIARVSDGYVSASYASGISSAPDPSDPGLPRHHARLSRGSCGTDIGGGGPTVFCTGPFTRWGGYNAQWLGGYTTQVDVYLDAAYAQGNPDSYGGNACLLTSASDPSCKGTRFDYTSAINNSSGSFLRDFGFTVGTGSSTLSPGCSGWVANAGTNVFRTGATPYGAGAQCIATTGWYTFRHTFRDVSGGLVVDMDILPQGTNTPVAHWQIVSGDQIANVGCNRYGWFADQEIQELPIDNSRMEGCGLATLVVQKACDPTTDTGTFNLQVDSATIGTAANCGQSRSTQVTPGTHTVGETGGTGTSLGDYDAVIGGACSSGGSVTLTAGQTATCTITNTRKATLTVQKNCNPSSDDGHFNLLVGSTTVAADAICGGSGSIKLAPGAYSVSETAGSNTSLGDYDAVIGGACSSGGSVTLTAGQTATCTISNTRKAKVTVTKTCPNGKQSAGDRFEVVNNGSRTGYVLDCGGSVTFLLSAGSSLNVTEAVPAGNTTTNLANYSVTYSGCKSSALSAGAIVACTITNTLITPRNQALSAGYWKNHAAQMQALLPVTLGSFTVASTTTANAIFNAMNCSSTKDQDAVGCLAGQLLAAKLDVKNGASNCINTVIGQADALLVAINYQGPNHKYTLTSTQRTQLVSLKNALDKYNSGLGC